MPSSRALAEEIEAVGVAAGDGASDQLLEHLHVAGEVAVVDQIPRRDAAGRLRTARLPSPS